MNMVLVEYVFTIPGFLGHTKRARPGAQLAAPQSLTADLTVKVRASCPTGHPFALARRCRL